VGRADGNGQGVNAGSFDEFNGLGGMRDVFIERQAGTVNKVKLLALYSILTP